MPHLPPYLWTAIAICAVGSTIGGLALAAARRRSRTEVLQTLFGQEYNRALRRYGDKSSAEAALESRRKRLEDLGVHELGSIEQDEYLQDWATIQFTAPNDPMSTMIRADSLLMEIMRAEGCPAEDAEERKIDLALMHPTVAEEYRSASDVLDRQRLGLASREECQRAVLRYGTIFDSILGQADLNARLKKVS